MKELYKSGFVIRCIMLMLFSAGVTLAEKMKEISIRMIALSVVAVCGISANAALPSNEDFTTATYGNMNII